MRLGFVGVVRWAGKLAEAFRACGAEIVAHDRKNSFHDPMCPHPRRDAHFGLLMPWREMLGRGDIDAIIAVAPPEVTTEVALACAAAGKPVMATKPLFGHPKTIRSVFYVDFWRLWSEAHRVKHLPQYTLAGCGPMRGFPGAFDYGPHVMAAVLDAGFDHMADCYRFQPRNEGELFQASFVNDEGTVMCSFGNGASDGFRNIWGTKETATHIGDEPKDQILQRFCQSFLNDVSEGFVDTRLLELSRRGMAELRKIREMASVSHGQNR